MKPTPTSTPTWREMVERGWVIADDLEYAETYTNGAPLRQMHMGGLPEDVARQLTIDLGMDAMHADFVAALREYIPSRYTPNLANARGKVLDVLDRIDDHIRRIDPRYYPSLGKAQGMLDI